MNPANNQNESLQNLSTYELARKMYFNLYSSDEEKFDALMVIKERDSKLQYSYNPNPESSKKKKAPLGSLIPLKDVKPPLRNSKRELIFTLLKEGKLYPEIVEILAKKKYTSTPSEIYSVRNKYFEC